jgi:hypothetical protein
MRNSANDKERDDKLMQLWGELTAAVIKRGFEFARVDDPLSFNVAAKMLQTPGATFEIRVSVGPGGIKTEGLVIDADAAPLARVFEITGTQPAQH